MHYLVDTHCHLYVPPLGDDISGVVSRAKARGVGRIVVPAINLATSAIACRLASVHPGFGYAAVGYHPQLVTHDDVDTEALARLAKLPGVVAVGEIGLDAEVEVPPIDLQERRFAAQLRLAKKLDLPVLIHCRRAFARLTEILREEFAGGPGGILHAWAGSPEVLRDLVPMGFFVGVAGTVTRPGATRARAMAGALPLDRVVVETDSPYIGTATKARGNSEPADAADVCTAIAELKGIPVDEAGRVTTENAIRVLRLPR